MGKVADQLAAKCRWRGRFRCGTNFAAASLFNVTGREASGMSSEAHGGRVSITCLASRAESGQLLNMRGGGDGINLEGI